MLLIQVTIAVRFYLAKLNRPTVARSVPNPSLLYTQMSPGLVGRLLVRVIRSTCRWKLGVFCLNWATFNLTWKITLLVHCISEILALKHSTEIFKCHLTFYLSMTVAKIWHSGRGPQWPQIAVKNFIIDFMQLICIIFKFCKLRLCFKNCRGTPAIL